MNLTLPTTQSNTSGLLNTTGNPVGSSVSSGFTGIKPLPTSTNIPGLTVPNQTITQNSGLTNNGQSIINTIPVTTTPSASNVAKAKPVVIPTPVPTNTNGSLRASTDSYMATPPALYDTKTGFVTPYGKSQGAKPMQPNDPLGISTTQEKTDNKSKISSYLDEFLGLSKQQAEKGKVQGNLENELGVNEKEQIYIDAFNQYQSKKVAYDQQIESIYNQPGITREQSDQQVGEISRRNNADLANLAVITQAAQGNYEGALDIVDRKVKAQFDPIQQQMDSLEKFIQLNQNDLSESEKIQLQSTLDAQKTKATELSDAYKGALQAAAQNGAPASVYTAIDEAMQNPNVTSADIYKALGKYGIDKVAQAQIDNIYSQINDRNNNANGGNINGTISGKPQTASQASANGYADRINEADVIISTLGSKFTGKLAIGGSLPNILQSADRQAYEQAKRNFVTAVLRRESGAAISPTEFDTAEKQYFPQAGDKADVIKQKENSRNTAINNLYREANVLRPVLPGQIIESDGKRYRVESDGVTITQL